MDNKQRTLTLRSRLFPLYTNLMQDIAAIEGSKATFCIQWGKNFPMEDNTGILFVGRATNGWITDSQDVNVLFGNTEDRIFNRSDQMTWVENNAGANGNSYNTNRSAFWRVIRQVTQSFYPKEHWSSYVAWSNVCKVAPFAGGNPNDSLYYAQLDTCQKILEIEIEILSPRVVVFFTGNSWSRDFLKHLNHGQELNPVDEKSWCGYKCMVYLIDGVTYIQTEHPQGKNETSHVNCIEEIINGILS